MAQSRSTRGWLLKGIDPHGPLVERIAAVAAGDGLSVEAWVTRWLEQVLRHHYPREPRDGGSRSVTLRSAALQADMRRNLRSLEESLVRIYRTVELTHETVERAEEGLHSTERHILSIERDIGLGPHRG